MPTYEIEQYEIHVQKYRVQATSEAEAVKAVFDGKVTAMDDELVFVGIADDLGLPADDYQDLADGLSALGETVDDVIPSIRSVLKVD